MKVKSESEVTQSCPTLSDPKDCSLPGSSVLGIFQARVLEWVPLPSPSFPAKKQLCPDFMAAITIHSDFRAQEEQTCYYFHTVPFYLPWSNGARCHDLNFLMFSFKLDLSLSSFTLIKRLFSSSSLSAVRVVSSTWLRLLIFLQLLLIPVVSHPARHFSWCTQCIG